MSKIKQSISKLLSENENRISLILFVITMCVAISPLISRYCINGHDLEYHLLRIEALKEGILIGKPFLKVNTLFFGGAGYASSMFYSDLFMYIPALLRVLGFGIGSSYHIFVAFIFVLGYFTSFYSALRISGSKYAASLCAIMFTLCSYHMDDMLVRAACGEYMAFVFVPLIIYSVYNIIYEDMSNPLCFVIGFAGLILSHPATLFFCIIFACLIFLLNIKSFIRKPIIIVRMLIATAVTILLTMFQWLPMLEQMMSQSFYLSADTIDMLDAAVNFYELFSQNFPAVGVLLLVCALPRMFISRREFPILKYADELLLAAGIFVILSTNIMPWEYAQRYLRFIQFPWRMFIMVSSLLAVADAIILILFAWKIMDQRVELILFLALAAFISLAISHQVQNNPGYYDYGDDYYSYKPFTANVIGGEWLPATVTDREGLVAQSEHMYTSDGEDIPFTRDRAQISAFVSGESYVDVPFIYYKGYGAFITTEDGNTYRLRVSGEGNNGMTRVYTEGLTGNMIVYYEGSTVQFVSYVVSILTFLLTILVCVLLRRKRMPEKITRCLRG